ncbi:MAG: TolC family protein [Pseudomonadota bacterium]
MRARYFLFLFLTLILWGSIALATPANSSRVDTHQDDLIDYVHQVVTHSDDALMLAEELTLSNFGVQQAQSQFRTVIRPIADLAVDSTTRPRTGIEFSRQTPWGIDVSAGYATDGFGSQGTQRSFAQVSIPVMARFGREVNELPLTRAQIHQRKRSLDVKRQKQRLISKAINQHIELILVERIEHQSEHSVSRASKHVASAKARQRVGLVSKVDVHRAELRRLQQVEQLEHARYVTQMQRESYAELARLHHTNVSPPTKLPNITSVPSQRFLPEWRPEWHAHQLDEKLAHLELSDARRRLLPDLNFQVKWLGTSYADQFEVLRRDGNDVYFSLRLQSDLDWRAKRRRINEREIALQRALRFGESLQRRLMREVRSAEANLKTDKQRLHLAKLKQKEANRALDVALARFERGIASNLDVIDAEQALSQAELAALTAEAGTLMAVVDLALARGELSLGWLDQALGKGVSTQEIVPKNSTQEVAHAR